MNTIEFVLPPHLTWGSAPLPEVAGIPEWTAPDYELLWSALDDEVPRPGTGEQAARDWVGQQLQNALGPDLGTDAGRDALRDFLIIAPWWFAACEGNGPPLPGTSKTSMLLDIALDALVAACKAIPPPSSQDSDQAAAGTGANPPDPPIASLTTEPMVAASALPVAEFDDLILRLLTEKNDAISSALVEVMKDREIATFQEVMDGVDRQVKPGSVKNWVHRANTALCELGSRLRFRTKEQYVIRQFDAE
jgi:hypothetical protein